MYAKETRFSKYFRRITRIPANLGNFNLEDAMFAFHTEATVSREDFYIKEKYNENHFLLAVKQAYVYSNGIHDFKYFKEEQMLVICSRYRNSAFRVYFYLILPLIPLFYDDFEQLEILLGLFLLLLIGFTLIMVLGIREESKRIEWEVVNRINYILRNNRRG